MGRRGANLAGRFLTAAAATPRREAVVVVDDHRPARCTYADVADRTRRLAGALRTRGVTAGDRVGVLLDDGIEHLEALLACFLLGAAPVNLSHRDTEDERRAVLEVADAHLVLHEPDLAPLAQTALCTCDWDAAMDAAEPVELEPERSGDDEYVLFTGGTTGRPKGVRWRHDDLYVGALAPAARSAVRTMPASPFAHGTGQWTSLATLLQGGTVVCRRDRGFDPERTLDAIEAEDVSYLVVVGDAFARPLVDVLDACPGRWRLSTLTTLLSGGAPLSPGVKDDLLRLVPTMLVVDGFGASESGGHGRMVSVAGTVADGPPRFEFDDDTDVLGDDHRPVAVGEIGWLARRGRVPLGYLGGGPDGDEQAFPVVDDVRWAIPGDRARRNGDGSITVLGRGASTINTGGHKVHAEEVERALRAHPAVIDAVVVGTPDERWGERVTAVVSAAAGATDGDTIVAHCRERLASYKVPRVVLVDDVRRTPAGKPDYAWAREVATTPAG
ncbi:MAG TPA: AMP-binding protein [Acidimicrobiales bacterium]|nr:AMP-binding protein [Acidimicrobiales bacterium]